MLNSNNLKKMYDAGKITVAWDDTTSNIIVTIKIFDQYTGEELPSQTRKFSLSEIESIMNQITSEITMEQDRIKQLNEKKNTIIAVLSSLEISL